MRSETHNQQANAEPRTLLQRSIWFYYLTAPVIGIAIWLIFFNKPGSAAILWVLAPMLLVCMLIPLLSKYVTFPSIKWVLSPRKLKTTVEGKWFLVMCIVVGFSAINSGDNLLYLILAMMLSVIITSGLLSEQVLKKLSVSRLIPQHIFADKQFQIILKVKNNKKRKYSYSLLFEDPDIEQLSPIPTTSYIFSVAPQQSATVNYSALISQRGQYFLQRFEMGTLFPFNFFLKTMERRSKSEIVVYPKMFTLPESLFQHLAEERNQQQQNNRFTGNEDFHSLHEYRHGDNPKLIHWRASAHHGSTMIKMFDDAQTSNVTLLFSNHIDSEDDVDLYENSISFLASATEFFYKRGFSVSMIVGDKKVITANAQKQKRSLYRIYKELALLKRDSANRQPNIDAQLATIKSGVVICVSPKHNKNLQEKIEQLRRPVSGYYFSMDNKTLTALLGEESNAILP